MLAVLVAGIPTLLAIPRAVAPFELPEPFIEPRALEQLARADLALVAAADREGLDTDVKMLGEALRAYGRVEAEGDVAGVGRERRTVAEASRLAAAQGEAALAKLRAYQLRSFLRELRRWEQTGQETDELRELGGPFLDRARHNGWIERRRLLPDEAVRSALFKRRWMDLSVAHGPALDLSPLELRALTRFLLLHPPRDSASGDAGSMAAASRAANLAEHYRIRKIDELRALDPAYPADLAKGVVYFRLRSYPRSAEAFRKHLEEHPDGPYALRAQNYLRAALGGAMDTP